MGMFEAPIDGAFVGLEGAETRLPRRWAGLLDRMRDGAAIGLLVAVQLAWIGTLAYFAYLFVNS
jgi:hypothetical protein